MSPRPADLFLRGLGVALLACVATDAWGGAWRVHAGELFPWRHLPGVALYGRGMLTLEWCLGAASGVALAAGVRRALAVRLGLVATAMGLSQRFSNHRSLLLIVLAFVVLAPSDPAEPDFGARPHPNLALVRSQLLLVYAFSVANKLAHGFTGGAALQGLFGWPFALARPLAWAVLASEIAVPALLLTRPRAGVAMAIGLHGAMALLLPSVWPFSITMVAMAFLFTSGRDDLSCTMGA